MAAAVTPTTAVESTATAAEACAPTRGITASLAAMVIAAEAAGAVAGLSAGLIESPRGLSISVERRVPPAGIVVDIPSAALHVVPAAVLHVVRDTALASPSVIIVAVVKCIAARVVAIIVIDYATAAPTYTPVAPAPSIPAPETDAEADTSPKNRRAAVPDPGIRIPARPGNYRIAVNQPRIIGGDIHHVGLSRLNDDVRALRLDGLLRRVLQIAGLLRFLAHHLNRVHHLLFLVVVGVAQRRGPGNIFVHVSQHGGKRAESFHAGVPGLLIHGLREVVALQIGIGLHPAVGFHDLRWKSRGSEDLRHQRIRVERDRRYELLQLLRRLLRVGRRLRGLRLGLCIVLGGGHRLR